MLRSVYWTLGTFLHALQHNKFVKYERKYSLAATFAAATSVSTLPTNPNCNTALGKLPRRKRFSINISIIK